MPYCSYRELVFRRLPEPGATDVPTNARLWLNTPSFEYESQTLDSVELIGPEGPVELTRTIIDTRWSYSEGDSLPRPDLLDLWVYTPAGPLSPGLHEVRVGEVSDWTFTVGVSRDEQAPAVPIVADIDYSLSEYKYGDAELTLAAPHALVILEYEDRASLDPSTLSGEAVEAWSGDAVLFGHGLCNYNWHGRRGASTRVRLSAFDVAGNHSGFGEWIDIDIPGGCDCRTAPSGPGMLLLGLALLRRRRRR